MSWGCFSATHRATTAYLSRRGCQAGSSCSLTLSQSDHTATTAGPGYANLPLGPLQAVLPEGSSQAARTILASMRCRVHDRKLESSEMFIYIMCKVNHTIDFAPWDILVLSQHMERQIGGSLLGLPKNWTDPSPGAVDISDAFNLFPHLRKAGCMLIV